jgi:hypothetical protein
MTLISPSSNDLETAVHDLELNLFQSHIFRKEKLACTIKGLKNLLTLGTPVGTDPPGTSLLRHPRIPSHHNDDYYTIKKGGAGESR